MRDSNYRSIASNKAAVTITTSLYDRRALDVTQDKPLVNSLNHLTYLVSSLAKVRETLSMDGGVERLVEILHECHNLTFNLKDNIFNFEKKLLTAWKWTLAFQCLVLIGTRGTEKIRQRLVKAGILPIIATVLDNYLTLHERSFLYTGNLPSCQYHSNGSLLTAAGSQRFNIDSTVPPNPTTTNLNITNPSPNIASQQQQQQQQQQQGVSFSNLGFQLPDESVQTVNIPDDFSVLDVDQEPTAQNLHFTQDNNNVNVNNNTTNTINSTPVDNSNNNDNHNNNTINITDGSASIFNSSNISTFTSSTITTPSFGAGSAPSCLSEMCKQLSCEDYESMSVDKLFKLLRENPNALQHSATMESGSGLSNVEMEAYLSTLTDLKKSFLMINIVEKLRQEKENDPNDCSTYNECDYEMDCDLEFLNDMYLQYDASTQAKCAINSKLAPRMFTETGVVIPRDDDIVWSLQLLAYILKYPSLKDVIQNTHLVIDMSIRDKQFKLYLEKQMKSKLTNNFSVKSRPMAKPKSRRRRHQEKEEDTYVERFNFSASNSPQMLNEITDIDEENFSSLDDQFLLKPPQPSTDHSNTEATVFEVADVAEEDEDEEEDEEDEDRFSEQELEGQSSDSLTLFCADEVVKNTVKYCLATVVQNIYNEIMNVDSLSDTLSRRISQLHLNEKITRIMGAECKNLSNAIVKKRKEKVSYLTERWDYDSYENFDIDEVVASEKLDYDDSLVEYKRSNLFPMVEKFTFLAGTDMYYWAGVIMRNSCRRNDAKGGVRQCGNLECGKWEKYPREFLKCRRCKRTKYCSRDCQMRAWQCHRNWCIPSTSSSGGTALSSASAAANPVLAQEPPRVDVAANPTEEL